MLIKLLLFSIFATLSVLSIEYSPVVDLPYGQIRGYIETFREQKSYSFKGIPFASPPVGLLRFVKPQDPEKWDGIRDTVNYGNSCPQPNFLINVNSSEDCLFLNVYVSEETFTKRHTEKKTVLFWIHGGGFMSGSGNEHDIYRGIPLVILEDIVLVTFNYRLASLGFLSLGPAFPEITSNLGLWDQNFALKWVHDNIHLFGGDPESVTIFGQSAGSVSVGLHLLSTKSSGLFQGAIMESGNAGAFGNSEQIINASLLLIEKVGCENAENTLECLQSVPVDKFVPKKFEMIAVPVFMGDFIPLSVNEALESGNFNDVNLMVGAERDEGNSLVCGTYAFAHQYALISTKSVYAYYHTQAPAKAIMPFCGKATGKVCHCDEIPFIFGVPLREPESYPVEDIEHSIHMMNIWSEFARNGKPPIQGSIKWPRFSSDDYPAMILNNNVLGKIERIVTSNCINK